MPTWTSPTLPGGRGIQAALDDSGKIIALQSSSPEATAEFVTWLLQRFPSPDDVTIQLLEWGTARRRRCDRTRRDSAISRRQGRRPALDGNG